MSVPNPGTGIPVHSTGVNTLFRFLHVSDPRDIRQTPSRPSGNTAKMFIEGSSMVGRSEFLNAIDGLEDPATIATAVQGVIDGFTPLASYKAVKSLNADLYEMAFWMNSYSANTPHEEVVAKRSSVSALSSTDEELLWDNLFYQSLKGSSSKTIDTILLMLRANEFINKLNAISVEEPFDEATTKQFVEIANALITVPRELIAKAKVTTLSGSPAVDTLTRKHLGAVNKVDITTVKIKELEAHIDEFKELDKLHAKNERLALIAAKEAYEANLGEIIGEAKNNPETGEKIFLYPEMDYTPSSPFQSEFVSANLSEKGQTTFLHFKKESHTEIADVVDQASIALKSLYDELFSVNVATDEPVSFRGITMPLSSKPHNNSMVLKAEYLDYSETSNSLYLTYYFEEPITKLQKVTITAFNEDTSEAFSSESKVVGESENHVTFEFFTEGLPSGKYSLSGDYKVGDDKFSSDFSDIPFETSQLLFKQANPFDGIPGSDTTTLYGVKKVGIGNFMRVEQEVCCYVPGEVSHIENIMAREYKEKATRELTRSETTTEETTEREVENLSDTTSTERHDLHSEVSRVLQENRSTQLGASAGVQGSYGKSLSFFANANFSYSNSSGLTNSFSEAESIAKEVVERSMERIVEKMTSKRTSRMLREYEQTNKHGFDNRAGSNHVTGIYRWVDKIYKNTLVNYGRRLMYDFAVPEPARNFKFWVKKNFGKNASMSVPKAPITPESKQIKGWADINRSNYANIAALYGAEVEPCPIDKMNIGQSFAETPREDGGARNGSSGRAMGGYKFELEIPDGYYCDKFHYTYSALRSDKYGNPLDSLVSIAQGASNFSLNNNSNNGSPKLQWYGDGKVGGANVNWGLAQTVTKYLPISISIHGIGAFNLNVIAVCTLQEDTYKAWQANTYMKIMMAYQEQVQNYKDQLAQYEAYINAQASAEIGNNDYRINPLEARNIEQRELKRLCMELMLAPYGISLGKDLYKPDLCPVNYSINTGAELDSHMAISNFMEDAFDWSILAYTLHPYYWGPSLGWSSMINEKSSSDPIFEAFLQSGMAKVTVPVKPGYETRVLYFLDTGKLPFSKEALPDDPDAIYKEVASSLVPEPEPMAIWETRMPTALTIIQDYSAPLYANGLPCFCEDGTPIATGNNLLNGVAEGSISSIPRSGTFTFPKDLSLTTLDLNKLIMNDGSGLAKVYQLSDAMPEQLGKFVITLDSTGDLTDESTITLTKGSASNPHDDDMVLELSSGSLENELVIDRPTWRGLSTPATAIEELELIRDYILAEEGWEHLEPTIVDGTLVIEETFAQLTKVAVEAFPVDSLTTVTESQPELSSTSTAFPLGKLVAIENGQAVISSDLVQTFTLESEFTVDQTIFNTNNLSLTDLRADAANIKKNIIVPAANGKVKQYSEPESEEGLLGEDVLQNRDTQRTQIVGLAIASTGFEVTVVRLSSLALVYDFIANRSANAQQLVTLLR